MKETRSTMHHVLIVDDDRLQRKLLTQQLVGLGYEVDFAADGEQALKLAETNRYDLVLLDYQMPGLNGVEVFTKLRDMQPEIRGVLVTAYASINTVFPAVGVGVAHVVAKPVDVGELRAVLQSVLAESSAAE